jgi:hypothetical protein
LTQLRDFRYSDNPIENLSETKINEFIKQIKNST